MYYIVEDNRGEGLDHSYTVLGGHLAGMGKGQVVGGQVQNLHAAPQHGLAQVDWWGPGNKTRGQLSAGGGCLNDDCSDAGKKAWVAREVRFGWEGRRAWEEGGPVESSRKVLVGREVSQTQLRRFRFSAVFLPAGLLVSGFGSGY